MTLTSHHSSISSFSKLISLLSLFSPLTGHATSPGPTALYPPTCHPPTQVLSSSKLAYYFTSLVAALLYIKNLDEEQLSRRQGGIEGRGTCEHDTY